MPSACVAEQDHIIVVTFTRPEKLNAIDDEMTAALADATARLRDDEDLRVMVIRAEGRFFSAGIDLNTRTGKGGDVPADTPSAGAVFRRHYRNHHLLYDEMESVEKPIVVAVQGPCLGAGLEMAASCDFRFCSTAARFELPEVRLGTIAGSGGASRLTRIVGPHWAKWLAMAGQPLDAQGALSAGLVHRVCEPDELDKAAMEFARSLAGLPREAVGLSKLVIDAAVTGERTTMRDLDRIANSSLIFSHEFQSRRAEFAERKGKP